jgi:hypothetical protein
MGVFTHYLPPAASRASQSGVKRTVRSILLHTNFTSSGLLSEGALRGLEQKKAN